ncbi:hypothetical protein SAMN05444161_3125 [Rhizobiales bacterium GAS191]|nr:hypothetical protein SAMN05444161_3125 [Rhizobiales bacterium GAS191]
MEAGIVTAADMARHVGIDPKAFRHRLRMAKDEGRLTWHKQKGQRWVAARDSPEPHEMQGVLTEMTKGR